MWSVRPFLSKTSIKQFQFLSESTSAIMVNNKKFVLDKKLDGMPQKSNFKMVEEPCPPLKDKEIRTECQFISVDPYQRVLAGNFKTGTTMVGSQVAKVIESKNPDFKVGELVLGELGWQSHFQGDPDEIEIPFYGKFRPGKVPDLKGLPLSYALGCLGMPGATAYFGFLRICEPKEGEVVVVNGAAGAVGSLVGQIAKIKGCKVIGFAGSDDKVKWLKDDLKFDYAYNYKKIGVTEALKESAPGGVDCFFDNVGGEMSRQVLMQMKTLGRVSVCGAISTYNQDGKDAATVELNYLLFKQIKIEGFIVSRWVKEFPEAIKQMAHWLAQGKLKVKELVFDGFDKTPEAFISLFTGDNTGKVIVKC